MLLLVISHFLPPLHCVMITMGSVQKEVVFAPEMLIMYLFTTLLL